METQSNLDEFYRYEYSRQAHSVGDSFWHFEWCPKYRYKIFRKLKYKNLAEGCIKKAANPNIKDNKDVTNKLLVKLFNLFNLHPTKTVILSRIIPLLMFYVNYL